MPELDELRSRFLARPVEGELNLAGHDPAATPFVESKDQAKRELDHHLGDRLFDLHELLFAEGRRSLLLVLQGVDCSGKNGTIKHVIIRMNPAGVRTSSFTEPTDEEQDHHFLWRYRNALPKPGTLGVFDRSHYEDVIVPTVHGTVGGDEIEQRIQEINTFEEELADGGTTVVKCLLHISYDEQRRRFLRRLRRDDKRWKFSLADLETRRRWDDFQAAYSRVAARTATDHAPWYVVPSDAKWYRNWAVAWLIVGVLDSLGAAYPQPDFDLDELRAQLEPPN